MTAGETRRTWVVVQVLGGFAAAFVAGPLFAVTLAGHADLVVVISLGLLLLAMVYWCWRASVNLTETGRHGRRFFAGALILPLLWLAFNGLGSIMTPPEPQLEPEVLHYQACSHQSRGNVTATLTLYDPDLHPWGEITRLDQERLEAGACSERITLECGLPIVVVVIELTGPQHDGTQHVHVYPCDGSDLDLEITDHHYRLCTHCP